MNSASNIKNLPIGIFDSGIGGLTVLREIKHFLPDESVIYIGDEAHFPYGEKTKNQICKYSLGICDKLIESGIKLLVIACNTITAAAFDEISKHVDVPVVGVIDAGVHAAIEATKNNCIGLLATNATIDSEIYQKKLLEKNQDLKITSVAAPKLVEFVEQNIQMVLNEPNENLKASITEYCQEFCEANCDTVVMACTHFPPLEPLLAEELGADVSLVSPSQKTAEEVANILRANNLLSDTTSKYQFYSTGSDISAMKTFWGEEGDFNLI